MLNAPEEKAGGDLRPTLRGDIEMREVTLMFGDKSALKNVSFSAKSGTTTAIIGPTAAGKTQLLYVLIGLLKPTAGTISCDGHPIDEYNKESLHRPGRLRLPGQHPL
ncbi:MAG: ATP-binding cassette domain-containing protein [Acidobacteriota bacterium]